MSDWESDYRSQTPAHDARRRAHVVRIPAHDARTWVDNLRPVAFAKVRQYLSVIRRTALASSHTSSDSETFLTAKRPFASTPSWPAICNIRINCMRKRECQLKSILDRSFRYTPSATTDLRKTFARLRREQHLADQASAKKTPSHLKIIPMKGR